MHRLFALFGYVKKIQKSEGHIFFSFFERVDCNASRYNINLVAKLKDEALVDLFKFDVFSLFHVFQLGSLEINFLFITLLANALRKKIIYKSEKYDYCLYFTTC